MCFSFRDDMDDFSCIVSRSLNTYDFHIIDEWIPVRPGIGWLAGEWLDVDLLRRIQIVQRFRE